jgi:hypothetical protein
LSAARELQSPSSMDLTPLGQAYEDFTNASANVRDRAIARAAREVCYWIDRALACLDDLYGGDDELLLAFAAYEHADPKQRALARDAYEHTLAFLGKIGAPRYADLSLMTEALLDHLTPFVCSADHAGRIGESPTRASARVA